MIDDQANNLQQSWRFDWDRQRRFASVTTAELRRRILPQAYLAAEEKIIASDGDLEVCLADWRKQGLRIGFTNGCFDILHPGHVKVLTAARGACDRLVVGLNSDASAKRLKGQDRPVQDARARAEVLAALEAVDLVVIFEENTPIRLISEIRPSVLVKGGDYTREQVVGHDIVEAYGGVVFLVDMRSIQQWKHPLQNRAQAYEHYQQFKKVCQPTIIGKFVDSPKTYCSDDDNNQYTDQN